MSKCKHENIVVYEENQYPARLVKGVVHYNSKQADHNCIVEIICMDCEETFTDVEDDNVIGGH